MTTALPKSKNKSRALLATESTLTIYSWIHWAIESSYYWEPPRLSKGVRKAKVSISEFIHTFTE